MDPSRYFTPDRPCRNGHSLRRLADRVCVECEHSRILRWKDKNREHVRDRDRRQKAKDPDKLRAQERARYAADPSRHRATVKAHYERNSEKIRERRRAYHHEVYPSCEEIRVIAQRRTAQWAKDNPERAKVHRRNGKARRRNVPGVHTASDIDRIFEQQRGRCAYCRCKLGEVYEVDHIQPVAKGGSNDPSNIQLTCAKCNRKKAARDPLFHAQTLGLLL